MMMRVIRGQLRPGNVDEFARRWHQEIVPKIHAFHDVRHVYMGVNRDDNSVSSFTLFESPSDEPTLEQWVQEFTGHIRDIMEQAPDVRYYEVVEDVG